MQRSARIYAGTSFILPPFVSLAPTAQLRSLSLLLGKVSSGQRLPITLRLRLAPSGRFHIRPFRQSAALFELASWKGQQFVAVVFVLLLACGDLGGKASCEIVA